MKKQFLYSVLTLLFLFSSFAQDTKTISGAKRLTVKHADVSAPLRDMIKTAASRKKDTVENYNVPNKLKKETRDYNSPYDGKDPIIQNNITRLLAPSSQPTVYQSFDGGSQADNAILGSGSTPPDTQGDVGPNHYIQMVNRHTNIFDKSGTNLTGPFTSNSFWQGFVFEGRDFSNDNDGDPVVVYDQFEDRWIVSHFAVSSAPYYQLIAVSKTGDPLGEYNRYAINFGTDFGDYPKLGIWNDAVYITTRDFRIGFSFVGFSIVGIKKDEFYSGVGTIKAFRLLIPTNNDGILPADADGNVPPPPGAPHYSMFPDNSRDKMNLCTTVPDWNDLTNSAVTISQIPVAPYYFSNNKVIQPNGNRLDVLPWFLMYRLQYRNFGTHQSMAAIHSVQESSGTPFGIRWYEFRYPNSGTNWDVYQQGTYLPNDGQNRWMGSIAMNGLGEIALGYSVASSTLAPSIRFTGQSIANSGSGIMDVPETSIFEGQLSMIGSLTRWGDYSMMSVDPTNDNRFWYTTEFVEGTTGFAPWGTKIAEIGINSADILAQADSYVGPINTPVVRIDSDSDDLLDNDYLGDPAGSLVSFGSGDLGGTVTDNISGATVIIDGNSLTVNADGSFTFIPKSGFFGDFIFSYRIQNADGTADAEVTITIDNTAPIIICPADLIVECGSDTSHTTTGMATATDNTDNNPEITFEDDFEDACGNTGVITRTWTATDNLGNSASCIQVITIQDTTAPDINTEGFVTSIDSNLAIPDNDANGVSSTITITEDRPITDLNVSLNITHTFVNDLKVILMSPVGTSVVIIDKPSPCSGDDVLAIIDDEASIPVENGCTNAVPTLNGSFIPNNPLSAFNGESTIGDWTLTISDNFQIDTGTLNSWGLNFELEPQIQDITVTCVSDIPAAIDLSATDACLGEITVSPTESIVPGASPGQYMLIRTWTFNDECGNTTIASQEISVNDEPPTITCPTDILVYNDAGECGAIVNIPDPTIADNCSGATFTYSPESGTFFSVGTTLVTATVTDVAGNTAQCTFNVTVNDGTPPSITCQNITVRRPHNLNVMITPDEIITSSMDNCDLNNNLNYYVIPNNFSAEGTFLVTVYATDISGNTGSCSAIVTVIRDCDPPTITCPSDVTIQCDQSSDPANTGVPTALNGCGDVTITPSDTIIAGNCEGNYTILRTWTATDENGVTSTCEQNITVVDTTPPVINGVGQNGTFECSGTPVFSTPSVTDNCSSRSDIALTFQDTVGSTTNVGVTIIRTWTAVDGCGNSSTASQTMTPIDTTPPTITCPSDVTVQCYANNPEWNTNPDATNGIGLATAVDNCDANPTITFSDNIVLGNCTGEYTILRTWSATDSSGNLSSCVQTINVIDNIQPVLFGVPADVEVECDDIPQPPINVIATDECSTATVTFIEEESSNNGGGEQTLLFEDFEDGTFSYSTSTPEYSDGFSDYFGRIPALTIDSSIEYTNNQGIGFFGAQDIDDGGRIEPTQSLSWTGIDITNINDLQLAFMLAEEDSNNGDEDWDATDHFKIYAEIDGGGEVLLFAVEAEEPVGDQFNNIPRVDTDFDGIGDGAEITDVFSEFLESIPGTGSTLNIRMEFNLGAGDEDIAIDNVKLTGESPVISSTVKVITRTWTATDDCGNSSSESQIITVVDTTPPVVSCPADITVSNDAGECGAIVTFTPTATDNCSEFGGATPAYPLVISGIIDGPLSGGTPKAIELYTIEDIADLSIYGLGSANNGGGSSGVDFALSGSAVAGDFIYIATESTNFNTFFGFDPDYTSGVASINGDDVIELFENSTVIDVFGVLGEDGTGKPWEYLDGWAYRNNDTGPDGATFTLANWSFSGANALDGDTSNDTSGSPFPIGTYANSSGGVLGTITSEPASGSFFAIGTTVVTVTATDPSGNQSQCTFNVTVNDTENPVITCPNDVVIASSTPGVCNTEVNLGTPTFSDNCPGATVDNDAPSNGFPFGDTIVTWTVTDAAGNTAECTQKVTVNKIETITNVTYTPSSQQYSDLVDFEATIEAGNCSGTNGQAAGKVEFFVGTQSVGTALMQPNDDNLVGNLTAPLLEDTDGQTDPSYPSNGQMAPGNHAVTAVFHSVNPNYIVANPKADDDLIISQEDAVVDYIGQTLQATPNANSSEATIALSLNILDIDDSNRGDIRNATVTIVNREAGNAVIYGPVPITDLVIPGDNTLGTISYDWMVDIGNLDSKTYTIGFIVDGYYTRNESEDNTVITVYKPKGDFITGGGYILPDQSAGMYASTDGLKTNFGFNVKYNKNGRKLKGHMNIIFRRLETDGVHTYQIKGNAIQSLGVDIADPDNLFAEFITKANLTDITDPNNTVSLGGNYTLKAEMTDRGEPGIDDSIGVNLTDSNGALLYSSNWSGISTEEMVLAGGNIVVHSGFSSGGRESTTIVQSDSKFNIKSDENPFDKNAFITLDSSDKSNLVTYSVFDSNNKFLYTKQMQPNQKFTFGEGLKSGVYLVIVQQGRNIGQIKMIKR